MMSRWFPAICGVALAAALLLGGLPILAVFLQSSPMEVLSSLGGGAARDALLLSLGTSALALMLIVVFGTPAAYLLATRSFRGRELVVGLVELPLVVPPAVAGIGLLAAFGPAGLLGGAVSDLGIRLVFETAGVVVALVFVSAPFYLRGAQAAFEAVDPRWVAASRTLGASEARTFARIFLPASRGGLITGAALAWGRALGEFGATIVFAGSLQGVTQTAPLAILELFGSDFDGALALSVALIAISGALLVTIKLMAPRRSASIAGPFGAGRRDAGR